MKSKHVLAGVFVFLIFLIALFRAGPLRADVIVDNGGTGTSYTGSWSLSGGTTPYGASSLWSRNGATYTFSMNGQQAGMYEVFMWWSGYSSRPSGVPVAVNFTGGTQNLTVNQLKNSGQWNSLGTFYFNGSGSVTITAAAGDTLSTCADAVQFKYVSSAALPVATIDSISPSPANPGQTVTFTGHGMDSDGTITGYKWTSSLDGALSTEPGFSTSSLSTGAHIITFVVTDNSGLTSGGATTTLVVGGASEEVIIDNTDTRTARTGTWAASAASGYYGTGSVWSRDGAAFTWKFTPSQTGNYNVSMWWTTTSSRSPSIPVQINNANGLQTVTINQLQNEGQWNSLGTFAFAAGVTYNITIVSQAGPTSTCADAVRFTLTSEVPVAQIDSITPNPAWAGQAVTFTGHGSGASIAAYEWNSSIDGAIGTEASFSTSKLSAGTHTITFRVRSTEGVMSVAAAESLVVGAAPTDTIIDNTDTRTARTGTWAASAASGYYGTGSVWSRDGAAFTWKFTPSQTGNYNVSMWWTTTSTRSSAIPVVINHAGGSQTVTINQLVNAGTWNPLGTFSFLAGTTYNITITSQAAPTSTCADAVRFAAVAAEPPAADFSASAVEGSVPLAVTFTDLSTGTVTSWLWDFGDGTTSTAKNPTHTYSADGYYTVSLTVSNTAGSNTKTAAQYVHAVSGSVEHIYIGDGYAKDGVFVPNVKIILKDLGATQVNDTWVYRNTSLGKTFIFHFVNTPDGFMNALRQEGAHIIWNGHSNFGLGGSFAQGDEVYVQEIDDIRYIDDDRFTHVSTPMVSVKIDGVQYGQAYPNWLPKFKNGTNGIMPYTFAEGVPPYNYYLTYKVSGDPTLYKIELIDGSYLERFPDSGVPAWFSPSGLAPSPGRNPEYFIVNNDPDYNRCDFTGTWALGKEADDVKEYNAYNYQYHAAGTGTNTATWTLVVRYPGYYQVTATWQSASTNASNASYTIEHDGGTTTVEADQRAKTAGYLLGTFYFSPGSYKVSLTDKADGRVVADSIRLSSIGDLANRLQAEFSASVVTGSPPLTVAFKDVSEISSPTGDIITGWFWDFGDGKTSTSRSPAHVYSQAGIYTVALTVTSGLGAQDTEVKTGVIRVGSTGALRALFTADARNVTTRTSVQFTDMSSGSVTSWLWDFGDGTTSTEQNPAHRFRTAGTYTVSLTVRSSSNTDTMTNTGYVQSVKSAYTSIADNAYHNKPHFFDSSGSYGKTILYGNTGITESELKYSRMFYSSCNSCNYFAGNFHRGVLFCTTSDSDMYTGLDYIKDYISGMSDDAIRLHLNTYQDIHEVINFNLKPPSLR